MEKETHKSTTSRRLVGVAGMFSVIAMGSGCSSTTLPKSYELGGLRVLALKADCPLCGQTNVPESNVGSTFRITPLVSDVDGGSRTVNFVAETCLDPGVSLGVTPSCDADPAKSSTSGPVTFSDATFRTGTAPTFNVTPPATLLDGRSAISQFNGVAYLVLYRLTAGTDSVTAFRRVVISTKSASDRNTNPAITGATVDGVALAAVPAAAASVRPVVTAGSAQTYPAFDAVGNALTKTEAITVSWYLNKGTFQSSRTDASGALGYSPPSDPNPTQSFFLMVVRDDRGGVDFAGVNLTL